MIKISIKYSKYISVQINSAHISPNSLSKNIFIKMLWQVIKFKTKDDIFSKDVIL